MDVGWIKISNIEDLNFVLNTEKTAHNRIQDEPEVCGLALNPEGKPDLSDQFVQDLKADIKTYKHLISNKMIAQEIFPAETLHAYRRHIDGQLAFVRFIKGPHHSLYLKFRFALSDGLLDD